VTGGRRGQPGRLAQADQVGLLGCMVSEEYGGLGIRDFRYSVVVTE
jgi:hypothetical protein